MESQGPSRKACLTDVRDDEWGFVAPYLTLMTADAPQRRHDLREVFNAVRWIVHTGVLALSAGRLSAVGSRLAADPALAWGRGLRSDGA
jgi:hypothetical protein